jgi:hypothetical protein
MAQVDFTVSGIVPAIQQPTPNTCWATAATILYSWNNNASSDRPAVLSTAAPSIVDPGDGTEYTESVMDFTQKFDDAVRKDLGDGADFRPQVVHY